jgi:outer membrane protein assembly factor BamC
MFSRAQRFFLTGLTAAVLSGCGIMPSTDDVLPDKKVEYKRETQAERNLEIPPDLTSGGIEDSLVVPAGEAATYSEFVDQRRRGGAAVGTRPVLPTPPNVEMRRDGDQRWLVVEAQPEEVWPLVASFWQQNGILLAEQDPSVGVMRTAWIQNRADIKSDFITDTIRGFFDGLYSASTRDQFRVRLERGREPGTTEVYLTHRGMEEEIMTGTTREAEQSVWVPRPTDHGLEAVMLQKIMVFLGAAEEEGAEAVAKAAQKQPVRAQLTQTRAGSLLTINEEFSRAWRLTGVALDRVGFAVEDRDRSRGLYFVRYDDPFAGEEDRGLLSKLAFWRESEKIDKDNQYLVNLRPQGATTEVVVLNKDGERSNSDTAKRILTLIHEQIR